MQDRANTELRTCVNYAMHANQHRTVAISVRFIRSIYIQMLRTFDIVCTIWVRLQHTRTISECQPAVIQTTQLFLQHLAINVQPTIGTKSDMVVQILTPTLRRHRPFITNIEARTDTFTSFETCKK